jgi:hypothetical protein
VREKEKSVLYKNAGSGKGRIVSSGVGSGSGSGSGQKSSNQPLSMPDAVGLSEVDSRQIEAQLSPEQLQLFAEENDYMLRHYEDTLGKVQYVFTFFGFLFQVVGDGVY